MEDCFIQFEQVKGESEDSDFKDGILVKEWNWGVNWQSHHAVNNSQKGKGDVRNFCFTHIVDSASPSLMARCINGKEISSAKLSMRKSGGRPFLYIVIKFEAVRLVNVDIVLDKDRLIPEERVAFSFKNVLYEYMTQGSHGGKQSGAIPFSWSCI